MPDIKYPYISTSVIIFTNASLLFVRNKQRVLKSGLSNPNKRVCAYYQLKELRKENKISTELKKGREMFIYLSKEHTSALNSEISEKIGGLSLYFLKLLPLHII